MTTHREVLSVLPVYVPVVTLGNPMTQIWVTIPFQQVEVRA